MTITPVVGSGGTVTKLRGAGHDVTDREERRRELETYETIVEAHGWDIRVVDGDRCGARFEITGVETAR
jgi:hypothetical protein